MPGIPMKFIDINGRTLSRTVGLVDSGCDFSTFPLEWAKELGIDSAADCLASKGETAGGEADRFYYPPGVTASIMGRTVRLCASFAPKLKVILLGREDLFRYFKTISFDQVGQTFDVKVVSDWDDADRAVEQSLAQLADWVERATKAEKAKALAGNGGSAN